MMKAAREKTHSTISRALDFKKPAHRVAITGCTCAALLILRTATLPSLLNLGGACACRSTSIAISARASCRRLFAMMSFGEEDERRAVQAERTSKVAVRLGAFTRATASLMAFFECLLNVGPMSGKGGCHLREVPRSP